MMKQTRRHGKQPPRIPGQTMERKDSVPVHRNGNRFFTIMPKVFATVSHVRRSGRILPHAHTAAVPWRTFAG